MCTCHREVYLKRRAALVDAVRARGERGVVVLPAAPVFVRNNDVEHEYRQDSDLFYVTGFAEPGSVLVLDAESRKSILFVRPRDPDREIWDGPRFGLEGVKDHFGADESFKITELAEELPKLLQDRTRLYYRLGADRAMDETVLAALDRTRARAKLGHVWPTEIVEPGAILHEMRLFKDADDLTAMRRAAEITSEAHRRAMAIAKPGMHEYEIEAAILDIFRRHGSERPAYGSIVGSGPNATILHYRSNDRKMEDGDLLLIDAGCEYDYHASDVTRTFPVNGTFSREQQAIYEIVLAAQEAGIGKSVVGGTLKDVHEVCVRVITEGLVKLGLLKSSVDEAIEKEEYKPFYMHKTSHWLGMDVHDVGVYFDGGKPRPLAPGMVLTVEPGIYIGRAEERVPAEWRGIGVRIEDDILVTKAGPENLTASVPKAVDDVVRACAS